MQVLLRVGVHTIARRKSRKGAFGLQAGEGSHEVASGREGEDRKEKREDKVHARSVGFWKNKGAGETKGSREVWQEEEGAFCLLLMERMKKQKGVVGIKAAGLSFC